MFEQLRISWAIRKGAEPALQRARRSFSAASCLYRGPIGPGAQRPFEYQLLLSLIQAFPNESERSFKEWLLSDNPMLTAYAISGLMRLGNSSSLKGIELPTQGEKVYTQLGCIGCNMTVHDLLNEVKGA